MGHGAGEPLVLFLAARLQRLEFGHPVGFQLGGFLTQTRGFLVIHRPHVCLGDRGDRTQHALLSAAGTSAIAGNERLVIAPHHEVVSQGRFREASGLSSLYSEEFLARSGNRLNTCAVVSSALRSGVSAVMRSAS